MQQSRPHRLPSGPPLTPPPARTSPPIALQLPHPQVPQSHRQTQVVQAPRSLTALCGALAGRILLKGDNITLMMNAAPPVA